MKKILFLFILAFGVQQAHAQLAVTINSTNVFCNGGCNGTATAVPSGGTAPYTYAWNPVIGSGASITGLCAGNYTVTVTDATSANASATCTITQPLLLTVSFSSTTISCNGGTGNVTANVSGGIPPYNYNWVPGNYPTPTITNVAAGSYTFTVTDANACTATGVCVLTQPGALTSSISPANSTTCVGNAVSFSTSTTGGTSPYAYSWTFPSGSPATSTSPTPSVTWSIAGTYTVTVNVTDANGCTTSATTTITPGTPPIVITPSYPTICAGSSLTMTGSGGVTYWWAPTLQTSASITVTPATTSTYTLTGTDAMGCSGTAVSTVYVNPNPTVTVTPGPTTICTGSNTTLSASGATTYTWMPGSFTGASITVSPASNITYTVTGTTAGCTGTASTTVNVSAPPTVSIGSVIEAGCNFSNGSATALASGFAPFTYNWTPSGITVATATGVPAGTYTVDVTDNVGCVTTSTVTIGDSCNFVWPGDANDDAVADNNDILDIGIANGATGTTRANATLNWIGQPSTPWGQTLLSGTDYKWVDCNGDGVIDPTDTNAVIQNFGLTHNNRLGGIPVYDATLPDLTITMGQNTLASNSAGSLIVGLGSSAIPVSNLYGLAFTLNFDPTQIDASTFGMNETGTWMGIPGTDLMGVIMNSGSGTGSVQIALTRLNHQNVNGFGNIANVGFMTTGNLVGTGNTQNVNFTISNVTVISANETPQTVNTVNDSVLVEDPGVLGISSIENSQNITAYPNPFDESVQIILPASAKGKACIVTLTDASGRVVLTQQTGNANTMIIQRGQLEAGIYFCTIRSEGQMIGNTKLIVK